MARLSFKSMKCVYNGMVFFLYTFKSGKPIGTSIVHNSNLFHTRYG